MRFHEQREALADRVQDCVHCGFCLPTCPTYVLWGEEMDSPRGRIHLVKLALEGEAELGPTVREHFDRCLGCLGCLSSCPSGVRYDLILEATRAQLEETVARPLPERWFRRFLLGVFPHRGRLRMAFALLWVAQSTGLKFLVERSGVLRLLPAGWRAAATLAPRIRFSNLLPKARSVPAPPSPRRRVALLEGCVQSVLFSEVNEATEKVLAAEGVEVIPVARQGCCGALELHTGVAEGARARGEALMDRFESVDVDHVVVNAAGCGSALKTLALRYPPRDPRHERAQRLADKVVDVFELLDTLTTRAEFRPLPARVAYHDACHLAHGQSVREAPRAVLRRIPEVEVLEVPDGEVCCGSAGVYNLLEPAAAEALGKRKAMAIGDTHADLVVAANPGCLVQIERHLEGRMSCRHPIQVLADQLSTPS